MMIHFAEPLCSGVWTLRKGPRRTPGFLYASKLIFSHPEPHLNTIAAPEVEGWGLEAFRCPVSPALGRSEGRDASRVFPVTAALGRRVNTARREGRGCSRPRPY